MRTLTASQSRVQVEKIAPRIAKKDDNATELGSIRKVGRVLELVPRVLEALDDQKVDRGEEVQNVIELMSVALPSGFLELGSFQGNEFGELRQQDGHSNCQAEQSHEAEVVEQKAVQEEGNLDSGEQSGEEHRLLPQEDRVEEQDVVLVGLEGLLELEPKLGP